MDLKPLLKRSIYSFDGSCNGLMCFNESFEEDDVYICNPATREYIVLPKFEGKDMLDLLTGFGYIPSTNQYKVVRIHNTERDPNVGIIQVYTLGSGIGWRNAGTIDIKCVPRCTGAFANGALHWVAFDGTIIVFHLADEKCSELHSPPRLIGTHCRYVGVLGGFLSVTYYRYPRGVDIWLLKKNEDNADLSWSKEFSFDSYIPQPFGIIKSGRLLCYEQHKIYCYDLETSSVKMDVSFGKFISEAIPHKNTLFSLKEVHVYKLGMCYVFPVAIT
ncbi:F-box protein At3g07870-like [Papaver somniferum]|uniref:F-box protein At3g07870-like n=1 Tax=Papaver somniferum TaxID=3469 RepID=UPI000E6FFD14|nr:F-box protein At3g07870-like [Papaver somniferum]